MADVRMDADAGRDYVQYAEAKLFNDKEQPTPEHLEMILWAYSPEPAKVKKHLPETKEEKEKKEDDSEKKTEEDSKKEDRKRRSSGRDEESSSKKRKD